jgi:hypothetical protein
MNFRKFFIIFLLLYACSVPETHAHNFIPSFYEGESDFTLIPAMIGMSVSAVPGFVIGSGGYIVGYAAGLPFDKEEDFSNITFLVPFAGITYLGSTVVGLPFFILEKTFYDFPRYLFESDKQTVH